MQLGMLGLGRMGANMVRRLPGRYTKKTTGSLVNGASGFGRSESGLAYTFAGRRGDHNRWWKLVLS